MNKVFILAILTLIPALSYGQTRSSLDELVKNAKDLGARFEPVAPFSPLAEVAGLPAEVADIKAQYLQLDLEILKKAERERPATLSLVLPYFGGEMIIDLVKVDILDASFRVTTSQSNGQAVPYATGAFYRGNVRGEVNSMAGVSFFDNELMGIISTKGAGNFNLGRVEMPGNRLNYVFCPESELPKPPGTLDCHADDRFVSGPTTTTPAKGQRALINGCVRVYLEADFGLFLNKVTMAATVNHVTGIFNNVAILYAAEDISTVISTIHVWTTDDGYPFGTSGDALSAFRTTRTNFDGDLAHLIAMDPGGLGGVAYLDVLCSSSHCYAYSDVDATYSVVPAYSWSVMVVTHEMGHNVGSNHTQNCGWTAGALDNCYTTEGGCPLGPAPTGGGTVMSYCHLTSNGINLANGFGTFSSTTNPRQKIMAEVTSAATGGCIANMVCTSIANTCGSPSAFALVGTPSSTSATFSWSPHGDNTSVNMRYRVYGTATWTTVAGISSPYLLTSLVAATKYEVEIQGICTVGSSDFYVGIYFKTILGCVEPHSLTASTTSTSASMNWTEPSGSVSWEIRYGAPGFNPNTGGTSIAVSSKPHNLTGLTPATTYQYYVRTNCTGGGVSDYSTPNTFSTRPLNDNAADAITLAVDATQVQGTNAGSTLQTSEPNPTSANGGRWLTAANNTVWYKFVAPPSGSVTITTDFSPQKSNNDTQLSLYQVGTVGTFSTYIRLISDDDNGILGTGDNSVFSYTGLTEGLTYYIQLDGYSSVAGLYDIGVFENLALVSPTTTCASYPATSLEAVNGLTYPNKWFNIYTTPNTGALGSLVIAIKSTQNLGTVTAKIANNGPGTFNTYVSYMGRYLDLQSQNAPSGSSPISVRLLFKTTDFTYLKNTYLNNLYSFTIDDLDAYHYDGANEDCVFSNNTSGLNLVPSVTAISVGNDEFVLQFTVNTFSELFGAINIAALPLELASFSAKMAGPANLVEWRTASEKNVAHHRLERSADGISNWAEIAKLDGLRDAPSGKSYLFMDEKPMPNSYYRLRSQDVDGTENLSNIASVVRPITGENLQVFPVPTGDEVTVQFSMENAADAQFLLFDLLGRQVFSKTMEVADGLNSFKIGLSELPGGTYFGILKNGDWRSQPVRVVKY